MMNYTHHHLSSAASMAAAKGPPPYSKYVKRDRNPDPKICALLVIDVQNHFSSVVNTIIPQLNTTIQICRRYSIPVIFTQHAERDPEEYPMLAEWWGDDLITEGTEAWRLIPELDVRTEKDTLLAGKYTYSAFRGTGLEDQLKGMGVREVIVTGVMTNLCCETTARDAFVRGFRVFFSTDATATSCEELHDATIMNLAYGFTYLVDCDSLAQKLS